ncbi:uridine kinase [Anaerosalibacter bizertensis]|uniref:Uridine kinase n=1 Tax=Anaerosalibacter bizertensis TaxID=932217 RepID=A0A844FFV7_9FIRM|nr:uridine kinase [Anaerosalibacter bizertensis]MBV1818176.1 uridine kinase [Bacteroidales bacterium MSK.15.36]HHV26099.1 uridine kinase [Tissierellia bacterium]MBU5292778.1 uridine kinase [Anaerosalibacter bizertensis]MCB5558440.1 uridine kinase [Anaerosalibacter bizertensis]MCG4564204.1 uridine kinase [Anaerosalibacter bizertensis]
MKKPILIGITGGTGSGKSTVAKEIYSSIKETNVTIIQQDSYYRDQSNLTFEERKKTNYDHPFAFDNELLIEHLNKLLEGLPVEKPIYDFEKHNRKKETITVWPREIIILEGLLILNDERIRELLDIKIFVDTDSDVRVIRRINRDIKERGRSLDSVIEQYMSTVRPAHIQFVEPSKKHADIIIPEGGYNKVAIDIMVTKIKSIIDDK